MQERLLAGPSEVIERGWTGSTQSEAGESGEPRDAGKAAADVPYRPKGDAEESWLERQIRRFRSFPHLDLAYRHLQSGRLSAALAELEKTLALDPADSEARLTYISVLYRLGAYDAVVSEAGALLDRDPAQYSVRMHRGLSHAALARDGDAIEDFEHIARTESASDEDRIFALDMIADLALRTSDFEKVLSALDRKDDADEEFSDGFRRGLALEGMGRYADAEDVLRKALTEAEAPEDQALGLRSLGEIAMKQGDYETAETAFKSALQFAPKDPELHRALANLANNRGQIPEALTWARKAAEGQPSVANREFLANLLYAAGDYAGAIEQFRDLAEQTTNAESRRRMHSSLGHAYLAAGRGSEAIDAFTLALGIKSDLQTSLALAQVLDAAGETQRAIDVLESSRKASPSTEAAARLGILYAKIGNDVRALQEVRGALAANGLPPETARRLHMTEGYVLTSLERHREAASAFGAAAAIHSDDEAVLAQGREHAAAGEVNQAVAALEAALADGASPEVLLELGYLYAKVGEDRKALTSLRRAIALSPEAGRSPSVHRQVGHVYYKLQRYAEARQSFRRALELGEADGEVLLALGETSLALEAYPEAVGYFQKRSALKASPEATHGLARAQNGAGQYDAARQTYLQLLATKTLGRTTRSDALVELGHVYLRLGQREPAAEALRDAIALGADTAPVRLSLALVFMELRAWAEALEQVDRAIALAPSARARLYAGLASEKLGEGGAAEASLLRAMEGEDQLEPGERKQLLNALGYALVAQGKYRPAVEAWQKSLALGDDPALAVSMARAQRLAGSTEGARQTLGALPPFTLPPNLQATALSETAYLFAAEGDFDQASEAERQAMALEPSSQRRYQLAIYLQQAGRRDEALSLLETVAAAEPGNTMFVLSLAYAYMAADHFAKAERAFKSSLESDPANVGAHKEIAYLRARDGDTDGASKWFRSAIDLRRAGAGVAAQDQEDRDDDVLAMRQEVRRLNNWWDVTAYQSFASNSREARASATTTTGGIVPSQGGVEVALRPPLIGFVDDRIFEVFGRLFWSNEEGTLRPDSDTGQGGLGFRYKPLKTQNMYVGAERLFGLGDDTSSNWLLRATYGWDDGFDLEPRRGNWNYSLLYGDLGGFLESPATLAFYGEARQGRSFRLGDQWAISPHLVLDGRVQDRDLSDYSYLEGGVGFSLKYFFNESSYEAFRSSIEVTTQYKAEILGFGSGAVVTTVLRF